MILWLLFFFFYECLNIQFEILNMIMKIIIFFKMIGFILLFPVWDILFEIRYRKQYNDIFKGD